MSKEVEFFPDLFDEHNVEHIDAYLTFCNTGIFPDDVLPRNFSHLEILMGIPNIHVKMAFAYAKYAVKGQVHGIPSIDQQN